MQRPFRFGVTTSAIRSHSAWVATARHMEMLGYSTLLIPDRTSVGIFSPLTALASAAEATTTLRVGSFVFSNEYRHPALLAREAATLDLLSEGRFELGLGAGVSSPEFQHMGIPYASAGTRVERLGESVKLIKQLFTQETVNFQGKHYTITEMKGYIQPAQQPHPPLLIAGAGERMLKLAAREANIIAIGSKITAHGPDPNDVSLEQKVAWIKETAGERFRALELSQTIYDIEITDSQAINRAAQTWPMRTRAMTTAQVVERLLEMRERYGISYLQIHDGQLENFAPVVAQLSGK